MNVPKIRIHTGPEAHIQEQIMKMLKGLDWLVIKLHGNLFQSGLPDLYAVHRKYGARWIEVKLPEMKGSRFTPRQLEVFPLLKAHGTDVWILTAATPSEYNKLFGPGNFHIYMYHK